ncbi:MAG TPA: hypothetical protein VF540_00415, partial [Segetibacter sp.]
SMRDMEAEKLRILHILEDLYNSDVLNKSNVIENQIYLNVNKKNRNLDKMLSVTELPITSIEDPQTVDLIGIKGYTRTNMNSFSGDFVSVSKIRNIYLIAHLTNADLSMMSDFEK